jgi:hypothetical protein
MKDFNFSVTLISSNIIAVVFDSQYDLCMSFVRMQEFYESDNPSFQGKAFDLETYMDWYQGDHKGLFSYPKDWSGFNLPGAKIREWANMVCDIGGLRASEAKLLLSMPIPVMDPYFDQVYVIATYKDKKARTVMRHETGHALFTTESKYKEDMTKRVASIPAKDRKRIKKWLSDKGYSEDVFEDEIQAFMISGFGGTMKISDYPYHKDFKQYFNLFCSSYMDIDLNKIWQRLGI